MQPGSPTAAFPTDLLITWRAVLLYLVLAFACFVPAFIPGQQIAGSDYVTGGFYFLEFAVQRMAAGHLPKWVPYLYGGVPMYANPGGLFYPGRLLFSALLPLERVMPAVYVVQFALAGIGMHLFVRILGVRPWVALVAGIMFQLTGVTFSYVYAGHDGRIIGATLSPFVFYFLTRAIRSGHLRWFAGLSATIGLMLLSFQLQSAYYVLLGGAGWGVFLLIQARSQIPTPLLVRRGVLGVLAVGFAFVLASVNILPFSGYVKDSPRSAAANRGLSFSTQFSMPPVETVGFAVPEQAGLIEEYRGDNPFKLHTEYVGALVLVLLAIGAMSFRRDTVWQFMGGMTVFMLTVCYGAYTPFYALYFRFLPGTSKFRSPSIALFMVSLALVAMASLTLETLATAIETNDRSANASLPRQLTTVLAGLAVATLVVSLGTMLDGGTRAVGWARFSAFVLLAVGILKGWMNGRLRTRGACALLAVVTAVDLWVIDRNFLWTQPPTEIVYAADDVVRFLKTQPPGRVWVFPFPNDSRAEHYMGNGRFGPNSDYLMHFGISQAGGEHGNQLYRWNRLAGVGSGGELNWHNFVEYPPVLNAAAVRYIISAMPLMVREGPKGRMGMVGLREIFHGKAYVYANDNSVARAALIRNTLPVTSPEAAVIAMRDLNWDARRLAIVEGAGSPLRATAALTANSDVANIIRDDPDQVVVQLRAEQPALLVLSDNYADGWKATVDGVDAKITRTNLTFRGVMVPSGPHTVVFTFEPPRFYQGLWISIAAWSALVLGAIGYGTAKRMRRGDTLVPPLHAAA